MVGDTRIYYAEGKSVFRRQGISPIVITELCISNRYAKLIANCLNLYHFKYKSARSRHSAAEKGEHNGNRNNGTTSNTIANQ